MNIASTDIILRSSDKDDIRVSKDLLSKSSGFFHGMFSIPQPTTQSGEQEFKDGLPVLEINDTDGSTLDGSSLRNLLLFCNPAPEMVRLDKMQRLAMKYDMPEVAKRVLRERTREHIDLIPPVMLAAIEKKMGRNNDAHLGAVCVLLLPACSDDLVALDLLTTGRAKSLKAYQEACIAAAELVASPNHGHYMWIPEVWTRRNWFKDPRGEHGQGSACNEGGNIYIGNTQGKWMMRYWWREYIYAVRDELKTRPCGIVAQQQEIFERALKDGSKCSKCAPDLEPRLREFAMTFAAAIDNAVSSVQLVYD